MQKVETVLVLQPTPDQERALDRYASAYAAAVGWLAGQVRETQVTDRVRLHRAYYGALRERFGLPAQAAVLCLKDAVRLVRREGDTLTADGPIPYDRHLFSLRSVDRLSLATLDGRIIVPCAVGDYRTETRARDEAELRREEGAWVFSLSSELPDGVAESMARRNVTMSDKLLGRIARLVSGLAHNAVAAAEQVAPVPAMEQAIRDIDDAVRDVKVEIGKAEAQKFNVARRMEELRAEHGELGDRIAIALKQGADALAEAGVERQIDIEQQIALLERSVADVQADIDKLADSLRALDASRREASARLKSLKAAEAGAAAQTGAAGGGSGARAEEAMAGARRLAEDLTGVPGERPKRQEELEELEELHRKEEIRSRLERIKGGMKE